MVEYRFPQGKFRRHGSHGLVLKHYIFVTMAWPCTNEEWDHEFPFENATFWVEV